MKGFAVWSASVLALACASQQPAAAPPQAAVKPAAVQAVAAPALSPVAKPADWVLLGRFAHPRHLVETIASWVGIPVKLTDLLPSSARSLETVVAWDAPIELAVSLEPEKEKRMAPPVAVLSVGVTSLEKALAAARERSMQPKEIAPGVYRVDVPDSATSCALGLALGSAPARLVCADDWHSVESLLPYATRGLPLEDLGTEDLHVVARAQPLQARYGQEIGAVRLLAGIALRKLQTDNQRLDRALSDAAYGIADELKASALDLDRIELKLKLDEPGNGVDLGYVFAFAKKNSFLAQAIEDTGKRSELPSEAFWSMPRATETASHSVGIDGKWLQPIQESATEIADAYLEQHKSPTAFRVRVRGLIAGLPALMHGGDHGMTSLPLPNDPSHADLFQHSLGLRFGTLNVRADTLSTWLGDAGAALTDREVKRLVKQQLEIELGGTPKFSSHPVRVAGFDAVGKAFRFEVPAAWFDRKLTGAAAAKAKPAIISIVVVPEGEQSFVAVGPDEKLEVARLAAWRSGSEGKLSENAPLAPLKQAPAISAGFLTLETLLDALRGLRRGASGLSELIAQAPNHGRSPWLSAVREAPEGNGVRLEAGVRLPRGALEDLPTLAPWLMQFAR